MPEWKGYQPGSTAALQAASRYRAFGGYPTLQDISRQDYYSYDAWLDREVERVRQRRILAAQYAHNPMHPRFMEMDLKERQELARIASELRLGPEYPKQRPEEIESPVPEWLPQYVPGQVAGAEMKKLPMMTPSAQSWARTPWWQRQELYKYGQWAGYPIEQRLWQMEQMIPRQPRGMGTTRWRPFKQW